MGRKERGRKEGKKEKSKEGEEIGRKEIRKGREGGRKGEKKKRTKGEGRVPIYFSLTSLILIIIRYNFLSLFQRFDISHSLVFVSFCFAVVYCSLNSHPCHVSY